MSSIFNSGDYSKEQGAIAYIPTDYDVACLQVGDMMLNAFGRPAKVTSIFAQNNDIHGKPYACFYTEFGEGGGNMSGSIKAGELVRHAGLRLTSAEVDKLQAQILADGDEGIVFFI